MESYDEFARRARIMTEVHALPVDENEGGKLSGTDANGSCSSGSVLTKESAVKKKEKDAKKKSLKRL
jgi:hypothetical protein